MKTFTISLFLLLLGAKTFAQTNVIAQQEPAISFSFGVSKPFIDNRAFDAWRETNYHINPGYLGGNFDLTGIARKSDFGIHISSASDFNVASIYYGRRLTHIQSKISSFLNLQVGGFWSNYTNIAPLDFKPTPDDKGQQLQLRNSNNYIALSSKNYINNLGFRVGSPRDRVLITSGFYVDLGFEPMASKWSYGYSKPDPNSSNSNVDGDFSSGDIFVGNNNVTSIPKLGRVFLDAGIFIAFGLRL